MDTQYIIKPLDTQLHDRAAFSSGVGVLDVYLKQQATQDIKRNLCVAYVLQAPPARAILGYYTLSAATIETTNLPATLTKRLPRYEALPAILIGRLAVDQSQQGRRLGEKLLIHALSRCLELSEQLGVLAVLVDAKDDKSANFYMRYDFCRYQDRPLSLYLPIASIPR